MQLPAEGDYTFVAYSLNTNGTTPAYSASPVGLFSANNDDDPLCGSLTTHVIEGDNNLTVKMFHQFSKVKVIATTTGLSGTPLIGPITTVLPGYKAKLDILGAGLVKDVAEDQEIGWPTFSPAVNVTSNERKVYAGGEANTDIKIPSVTIGGTVYAGLTTARFLKRLEPGKRYTLTLAFKNLQFAGSNIYWTSADGGKLTFDGVGVTTHQSYQGVMFKWGSLVGISPVGESGVRTTVTPRVYVPEFNSGSNSTWTAINDYSSSREIPYISDGFSGTYLDPTATYLIDDERNTANNYVYWNAQKGDICRYISENGYGPGGNYRLPTAYELGVNVGTSTAVHFSYGTNGWTKVGATWTGNMSVAETYADGGFSISWGASHEGVFFPASGNRIINPAPPSPPVPPVSDYDCYVTNVGNYATCWSATVWGIDSYGHRTAYRMSASSSDVMISSAHTLSAYYESVAFPIRCVKY
jgi:hypothetical protein